MRLGFLTIEELQSRGILNDEDALIELGKRVLNIKFNCNEFCCEHEYELAELQVALDSELPPECPHCGKFISDI